MLAQMGRWSEAADQLTIALQLDPNDTDVQANLDRVKVEMTRKTPSPAARAPMGKAP